MDGENIGPYFPPAHPHPARQPKSPAKRQKRKTNIFDDFQSFYINQIRSPARGLEQFLKTNV